MEIEEGNGIVKFPLIAQNELFEKIINSDYNVFMDNSIGIHTPGKIFENLALGISLFYIKPDNNSKTFEFVKNCGGIRFVKNDYTSISKQLLQLKKNDKKIKCNFELSLNSWKNLASEFIK